MVQLTRLVSQVLFIGSVAAPGEIAVPLLPQIGSETRLALALFALSVPARNRGELLEQLFSQDLQHRLITGVRGTRSGNPSSGCPDGCLRGAGEEQPFEGDEGIEFRTGEYFGDDGPLTHSRS